MDPDFFLKPKIEIMNQNSTPGIRFGRHVCDCVRTTRSIDVWSDPGIERTKREFGHQQYYNTILLKRGRKTYISFWYLSGGFVIFSSHPSYVSNTRFCSV